VAPARSRRAGVISAASEWDGVVDLAAQRHNLGGPLTRPADHREHWCRYGAVFHRLFVADIELDAWHGVGVRALLCGHLMNQPIYRRTPAPARCREGVFGAGSGIDEV
jgi:hypothetical protein